MLLRVLGSSGAEFPGHYPPSFLVDGKLLLDAGTIGARLTESEQWSIRNILITHSHLDHIKGIPFLADNIIIKNKRHSVTVFGIRESLLALRKYLLNDRIWPDFTRISASDEPVLKLKNVTLRGAFAIDHYSITACRVNHTVPAVGYVVSAPDGKVLLYTGDTGPTDKIWTAAPKVDAAIVEVSFPNRLEELAIKTGHLTARLLMRELKKMEKLPRKILITHPKPQYIDQIRKEVGKLRCEPLEMLENGRAYEI